LREEDVVDDGSGSSGAVARVGHGLAAVVGRLSRELGLIDAIEESLRGIQRRSTHSVGKKLTQVLLGIACGNRTMIEFQEAGTPLSNDLELVSACGFTGKWAENSVVCALLRKFDDTWLGRMENAVIGVFRHELVKLLTMAKRVRGRLVVDMDLSGQAVTGEANSFSEAEFSYIRGKLAKGYQLSSAVLDVARSVRWILACRVLPGKSSAAKSVPALVEVVERTVGRPLRRVDAVRERVRQGEAKVARLVGEKDGVTAECERIPSELRELEVDLAILERKMAGMTNRGRGVQRLRQLSVQQDKYLRERKRLSARLDRFRRKEQRLEKQITKHREAVAELRQRLERYEQDNETNSSPVPILLRADSAYGTAAVLDLLYELGYDFVIKTFNGEQNKGFFDSVPDTAWRSVGEKAKAAQHPSRHRVAEVSYDLRLIAYHRTNVDKRPYRAIIATTLTPAELGLRPLVRLYNERQHIEATYGECKNTLEFGAPRIRTLQANGAFALMVMAAYNLLRLTTQRATKAPTRRRWTGFRFLVRVLSHAPAVIQQSVDCIRLTLAPESYRGGEVIEFAVSKGFTV
jgi:hypothetical protein